MYIWKLFLELVLNVALSNFNYNKAGIIVPRSNEDAFMKVAILARC
jgi:hypothetical protein